MKLTNFSKNIAYLSSEQFFFQLMYFSLSLALGLCKVRTTRTNKEYTLLSPLVHSSRYLQVQISAVVPIKQDQVALRQVPLALRNPSRAAVVHRVPYHLLCQVTIFLLGHIQYLV